MALELGNILGAAANFTTKNADRKSLKDFLHNFNSYGLQVKNNFEVNFSGLEEATFFIQSIEVPGMFQNTVDMYYNGRKVEIPVCMDYEHDFSMVVYNDAKGYIYAALTQFLAADAQNRLVNSGYTMTITALTGNEKKYPGSLITMTGVRITSVGGLSFGYSDNDVQTFTVNGKLIEVSYTPGGASNIAGVMGTINSLLG